MCKRYCCFNSLSLDDEYAVGSQVPVYTAFILASSTGLSTVVPAFRLLSNPLMQRNL